MLRNYLTIAFRNLFRNKVYSLINVFGLALGMAAAFFIFQYVYFETSYDRFHTKLDRLYRVPIGTTRDPDKFPGSAATHPAVAPSIKAQFPQVEDFVRLAPPDPFIKITVVSYKNGQGETRRFNETNYFFTDGSFFNLFTFPLIAGDPKTALVEPESVVITERMARKYFGNEEPMGKILDVNGSPAKVTKVCRDVPENSHIKFTMLVSLSSIDKNFGYNEWGWPEFYNYVLLRPGVDAKKLEPKLSIFTEKHLDARTKPLGYLSKLRLQPVKDIHLKSNYRMDPEPGGNKRTIYFLSILGVFTLIIAWINYINLSTAKSMERAREVGLRKVAGASRFQISGQFLLEAIIINCIALVVAAAMVIVCTPYFEQFIERKISGVFLSSGLLTSWSFWLLFVAVFTAGALQTGIYPAFVLSAFNPVVVLKGKFHRSLKGILLRKGLVTFQFTLSILLIAGTMIIYRQLTYMQNNDTGYNKDQILVVKSPAVADSTFQEKIRFFKNELLKQPAIKSMAPSTEIPGKRIFARNSVARYPNDKDQGIVTNLVEIDKDFIPTYQMELACGNNLPEVQAGNVFETLNAKVLLTEKLVEQLGFASNESALHQTVYFKSWFGEIKSEIVGVLKNFNQRSLKETYEPVLFYYHSNSAWGYFSINMQTAQLRDNMAAVEKLYHQVFPGNAFESFFLNEYFNRQYKADQQFGNIFSLFTILAIVIACLGLTGLSTYAIKVRTKEIGIRKVLGASARGIVYLFYRDFIKLVLLAALVAIPVVYYLARQWLDNFAFHISLSWLFFAAAPILLLFIAFVTIGLQSVKAALDNPVNSLRND